MQTCGDGMVKCMYCSVYFLWQFCGGVCWFHQRGKSTAVSESTAEEKQPYEILREKEDETKQIAADEEQQVKELQDALNAVNFYYEEFDGGDALMGVSPNCEITKTGKKLHCPSCLCFWSVGGPNSMYRV